MKNQSEFINDDGYVAEYLFNSKRDRDAVIEAFGTIPKKSIKKQKKKKDSVIQAILQKKKESSIISDMKSDMVYTQEEIESAVTAGENILIDMYDDPSKIDTRLRIRPFKAAEPAYTKAFRRASHNNKKQLKTIYESVLIEYRKAIELAWNHRHPLLSGKLTMWGSPEEDHLWIQNK